MQQQQEHQGLYTREFSGLDLSNSAGDIDPSSCTVFQNCDISSDGAIVRRGGTSFITRYDFGAGFEANTWHTTVKTKLGTEYLVVVNSGGIVITQFLDSSVPGNVVLTRNVTKLLVWSKNFDNVNFVTLSAPYDRLLIFTGTHPVVELSFLERELDFFVSVGANTALSAPYSVNDYYGWADTNANATLVWDYVAQRSYTVVTKNFGFDINVQNDATLINNTTRRLRVASITWQWWAEAMYNTGADYAQTVSRVNVTDADQNVAVPVELITNYPQILRDDVFTGLTVSSQGNVCANTFSLVANPATATEYQTTMGGRFINVAGSPPQPAPFFVTFGQKQASGISPCTIYRRRILPFRREAGVQVGDLRVYVDNIRTSIFGSTCATSGVAWTTWQRTRTSTQTTYTIATVFSTVVQAIEATAGQKIPSFESEVKIFDSGGTRFFGSNAQAIWLLDKDQSTVIMDGRFVGVYGIGDFCDYNAGNFSKLGALHRDRLVLTSTSSNSDQLVVSAISDTAVPNEYFTFFQIDDALKGDINEPFSFNVVTETKSNITALVSWQEALLAFTSDTVFSIVSGEQFSLNSFRVSLVASYGTFNQRCVSVNELSIVYMNRYGVFDLVNKPNTSQLGVSERSARVRKMFGSEISSSDFDNRHWLIFDESSSLLYVGLVVDNTRYTKRHLVLNTRYDAWSTFTSAVNFSMLNPTKIYSKLLLFATGSSVRYLCGLLPNQPYYMDFAVYAPGVTWTNYRGQVQSQQILSQYTPQRIFVSDLKFAPFEKDAIGTGISKFRDVWVGNSAAPALTAPRLTVGDNRYTAFLVGGVTSPVSWVPYAAACSQTPWTAYPQGTLVAADASGDNLSLSQPTTVNNVVLPNIAHNRLQGVVYTSIASSKVFNFSTMGRLKRLKRLHLQFDTSIVVGRKYNFAGLENCRQINTANTYVTTDSNHVGASSNLSVDFASYSTGSELNSTFYDASFEAIGVKQHSIPLAGYGVQYRWWVSSVGAEAFKINGYEFDVTPATSKRYQPG